MNFSIQKIPQAMVNCLLAVAVMVSLFTSGSGTAAASTVAAAGTLSGVVTVLGSGSPVVDGVVVATQSGAVPLVIKGSTDGSGAYNLNLGTGDWQIEVKAHESDPTFSPAWVYTAGLQIVTIPTVTTLDLTVTLAAATIKGTLLLPLGTPAGTTFSGGNGAAVRAANQEGQGNTVQVQPDGSFSIHVLPGNTLMRLALKNPNWSQGTTLLGSIWSLSASDNLTVGVDPATGINPLQLLEKLATISGVIKDESGAVITGLAIPIKAWRVDGSEVGFTQTDPTTGQYTISVVYGEWSVWPMPTEAQPYVSVDSPKHVSLLTPSAAKVQDLTVSSADVTISGQVVDQNNLPVAGIKGRVIPTYLDKDGIHWRQFAQGAPVVNSVYNLKVSSSEASHYRLHASFNNLQDYTEVFAPVVNLTPGVTSYTDINLPIAANNSKISGQLVDQADVAMPGIAGAVFGVSDGRAFAKRRINPVDASYEFDVAATNLNGNGGTFWWLHAFVDPTSGYSVIHPATQKVFLPSTGADVSGINFTVAALNATLRGTVTDPQGVAVRGVKVGVWEQNVEVGKAFTRWVETGPDGQYNVKVPAGTYKIGADFRRWTSPVPAVVTMMANQILTQDLQFRANNAWIVGQVTENGSGHAAMIRAYSSDGAHAGVVTDANGNYALHVNNGVVWNVQATSEDGSQFLRSSRLTITPKVCVLLTGDCLSKNRLDLPLALVDSLPGAVVFRFDATQNQTFTLSDGAQVVVPANAMADNGFVTLVVRPLANIANDGVTTPVSFGYRLLAFDDSMMPIDRFNAPVTLVMPFTAEQLSSLSVTPDNLIPQYWDVASNSFKPIPSFSVTVDSSGNGSLNLLVEHFTDYALTAGTNPATLKFSSQIFLPMVLK